MRKKISSSRSDNKSPAGNRGAFLFVSAIGSTAFYSVILRWPRSGPRRATARAAHPSRLAALAPQDDGRTLDISEQKAELRREMVARRDASPEELRSAAADAVAARPFP